MLSRIDRKPPEAVYRFRICIEYFKDPVHSREFQSRSCSGRDRGKLDVAVALYGFFQTTKQKLDGRPIHMGYL
jgi:hypothetical protein